MRSTLCSALLCLLAAAFVALSAPAQVAAQTNPNFEYGVDRRGGDYRSFDLQFDAPGLCAGQCVQEGQCRAWTYVKPGVQGPKPEHLTFTGGAHLCIGASTARLVGGEALRAFVKRFDVGDLEFAPGFEYHGVPVFLEHGPERLDVRRALADAARPQRSSPRS